MHPILFKSAHFTIYSYGVCVAVAVLVAWMIATALARRAGFPVSQSTDLLFVMFISGVVGGRLFYVAQHWPDFSHRLFAAFFLNEGGLVWYGGFLVAIAGGYAYARVRRLPARAWADLLSVPLPAAHAIGRVGCFLNGCCFGTSGHPVQLYEAAFLALLSGALFMRLLHRKKEGEVFALYLIAYGTGRFLLEMLRGDQHLHLGLTVPQWTSIPILLGGIALLRRAYASDVPAAGPSR